MAVRWLHVVAGIAWIGSSFYFIALDLSLRRGDHLPAGVQGEAWQVHGGGFYQMMKYLVAPPRLPDHLTWFKWEAYTTWLSGFALLCLVFLLDPDLYLIDPAVMEMTAGQAAQRALMVLAAGYLVYELMCRSPLGRHGWALSLAGYCGLVAAGWALAQVFSGRGAFVLTGALIGTIMVGNVLVVIIPNQKKTVAALLAGTTPDPAWGWAAKQRSLHNNYLTLPVVFLMLSGHYPLLFATRFNWLILAVVLAMGPVLRHFFNSRHAGRGSPWWTWGVAAAGLAAIIWLSAQGPRGQAGGAAVPAEGDPVEIVQTRCAMCHARQPLWAGIAAAPRGVLLEHAGEISRQRALVVLAAVHSDHMPPGNLTGLTPGERAALAAWAR